MAFEKQIRLIAAVSLCVAAASLLTPATCTAHELTGIEIPELKSNHRDFEPFTDSAWNAESFNDGANAKVEPSSVVSDTPVSAASGALPMPSAFCLGAAGLIVAAFLSRKLTPAAA